jgi:tetratricopeptide (TPR) repeat protein
MSCIQSRSSLGTGLAALLLGLAVNGSAFGHAGIHKQIDRLGALINDSPDDPELYLQRAETYRIHGAWEEALRDYRVALAHGGDAGQVETGRGRLYAERGSYDDALSHLDKAILLEADNVRALVTRAEVMRATGQPLAAAADYTRAIAQFDPPHKPLPEYYLERAHSYEAAGTRHLDKALSGLDEGIATLGPVPTLTIYAVELEARLGRTDAALARLDRMLEQAQRRESLLLNRAEVLLRAGRRDEARHDLLAAEAAIAGLPASRRQTWLMDSLLADIRARLAALDTTDAP